MASHLRLTVEARARRALPIAPLYGAVALLCGAPLTAAAQFAIEEATIASIQAAIRDGQHHLPRVVEAYIERAKAYNGVCTALVTADGAPIVTPARLRARRQAARRSRRDGRGLDGVPELDEYQGLAARLRPHGADRLRSDA